MSSSSHNTPALCASSLRIVSSSRYTSHLSAIHVDLHCVGCRHRPRGRWVELCAEKSCGGRGQLPAQRIGDNSRDIEGPIKGCDARCAWRWRSPAVPTISTHRWRRSCPAASRASPTAACSPPPSFSPSRSTSSPHLSYNTSLVTGFLLTHPHTLSLSQALVPLHFAWFQWFLPCTN
jgi:hypothetical protein